MEIERDIFPSKQGSTAVRPQNALPTIEQKAAKLTSTTFTAGTDFTVGAGAAGTAITISLPFAPILGAAGRTGCNGNSSLVLGGALATTLTTEVPFVSNNDGIIGITTSLGNGEYMVDYETGMVYAKKADAGTTGTATYSYWLASSVAGTGTSSTNVQGTTASGTTAVGNPVLGGGVFNTTAPSLTNGQVSSFQLDSSGNQLSNLVGKIAGENFTTDTLKTGEVGSVTRITTATTTVVKSGLTNLLGIRVEVATTGIVTIYNNTAASGATPYILPLGLAVGWHPLPAELSIGCTVVTAAADRICVVTQ